MTEQHAAIISAVSALISAVAVLVSTGFVIWATCFRKTRRDRIDELKVEMRVLISNKWGLKMSPKDVEPMFRLLKPKFQTPEYKELHAAAYHELRAEGKLEHIFHLPSPRKET